MVSLISVVILNRKERTPAPVGGAGEARKGLKRFFFALLAGFAVNSVRNSSNYTIKGDYQKWDADKR